MCLGRPGSGKMCKTDQSIALVFNSPVYVAALLFCSTVYVGMYPVGMFIDGNTKPVGLKYAGLGSLDTDAEGR